MTGTVCLPRAGSALAVGVAGWLAAHVLTLWLISHSHGGTPLSTGHVHGYRATAAAVAGLLAMAALTVVFIAWRRTAGYLIDYQNRGRSGVARPVVLSTLAFLVADAIEHAILDLERTPPALLLLGTVLHALFSVGGSLCWLRLSDAATTLIAWLRPPAAGSAQRLTCVESRPLGYRRLLWADAVAGRAPPAV